MIESIGKAIAKANRTRRPEHDVRLRSLTLAGVLIAVLAVMVTSAAPLADGLMALALLPVGAWVSYQRRDKNNGLIKILLTVGAVLALSRFFNEVRVSLTLIDTRQPLASLFLTVQVLHGFDLPQRRDLGFTLASSLTLVALAATDTSSVVFGLLMAAYAVIAAFALLQIQRSTMLERAEGIVDRISGTRLVPATPRVSTAGAGTGAAPKLRLRESRRLVGVVALGLVAFLLLPRSGTTRLAGLPFRGLGGLSIPGFGVFNPGIDLNGGAGGSSPVLFNPAAYFGLAEFVDLRTAGQLSDEPILRVRADRPRFWRGMVFDQYDGVGWRRTAEQPDPSFGQPVQLDVPRLPGSQYERVVQTFELLGDTPNLIFAAGEAREVYHAANSVTQWRDGTITTSAVQDTGTIYSVVSLVESSSPELLRRINGQTPAELFATYTQLPASLPERVKDLAASIAAGAPTNYAKAEAIEDWLGLNVEYTLDAIPPRQADDLVDHFLFESRKGWCEPIASSMVVMLRSVGVPARFATGFQPGQRNPLTGIFDVKMSNAHAWVEVWVPAYGWIPFDPTGAVPEAVDGTRLARVPLFDVGGWLFSKLAALVPQPVKNAGTATAALIRRHPLEASGIALAALAAAAAIAQRRRRARAASVKGFARLTALLAEHGVHRDSWQTPREFAQRIRVQRPSVPHQSLQLVVHAEEMALYSQAEKSSASSDEVEQALSVIEASLLT